MTRFGEISPLWQNFKSLWAIVWVAYFVFVKLLYQLWRFYANGQIVTAVNGQRLNSKIAIWSHWTELIKDLILSYTFYHDVVVLLSECQGQCTKKTSVLCQKR